MCRWLTYSGSPIRLESLIFEPEFSLVHQSLHARKTRVATNGDGFGIGWYGDRVEPGIYRDILPAWSDPNLRSLAHQISSRLFFAHVRASTGTATSRANCHPFAQGRWMFMHNGQIGCYDRVRRVLDMQIPDDLYPHRMGTTDSEVFFLMLFRHGLEDDPLGALTRTVAAVTLAMGEAAICDAFRLTAVLTNGERIIAVRHSTDPEPPSLFFRSSGEGVVVVSEPLDADIDHWTEVPPGHVLIADGAGVRGVERFAP
jgi:glutamine amidotransferase